MAAMAFPYSYYRCSCNSTEPGAPEDEDDEDADRDETFDPSDPRSDYCLYPLDSLMWCEDCHDIRCPRCTVEEIVCWYCPNCLFEVPGTTVKSEGNRYVLSGFTYCFAKAQSISTCTIYSKIPITDISCRCSRNCFNCPECLAQLQTLSLDPDPSGTHGPYILNCTFCNWSSLSVGLKFDSPRHILEQLQKNTPHKQKQHRMISRQTSSRLETVPEPPQSESSSNGTPRDVSPNTADARKPQDPAARFANLKDFYREQTTKGTPGDALRSPGGIESDYSSPGNLQRIMNLYNTTTSTNFGRGKPLDRPRPLREAAEVSEGLSLFSAEADVALVEKLRASGLNATTSPAQRAAQCGADELVNDVPRESPLPVARFLSELRPIPTLLCTKRSARCSACRHILVKPEPKVGSTRYRIKLIALEKVPSMSLKPLVAPQLSPTKGGASSGPSISAAMADLELTRLPPGQTLQFLLKLTNPMFEALQVSLATPSHVPSTHGTGASRVTILCPEFTVGANSDMWDEALSSRDRRADEREGEGKTAVAGRVWERGRNWTTVVVEVVPEKPGKGSKGGRTEDADVLEIPVFVRLVYEAEGEKDKGKGSGLAGGKERRTLSYWAVLGVGRVAMD